MTDSKPILDSLCLGVKFIERNVRSFHIDGLFGVHALFGLLLAAQELFAPHSMQAMHMIHLTRKCRELASIAYELSATIQSNGSQFERLFLFDWKPENIHPANALPLATTVMPIQKDLDNMVHAAVCIPRFLNSNSCYLDPGCRKWIMSTNSSGYVLTHQLMLLYIARKNGCWPRVERFVKRQLNVSGEQLIELLLARLFTVPDPHVSNPLDLHAEKIWINAILGRGIRVSASKTVNLLLERQMKSGCFSYGYPYRPEPSRRLLTEKVLEGRCLVHFTVTSLLALASVLITSARYPNERQVQEEPANVTMLHVLLGLIICAMYFRYVLKRSRA